MEFESIEDIIVEWMIGEELYEPCDNDGNPNIEWVKKDAQKLVKRIENYDSSRN